MPLFGLPLYTLVERVNDNPLLHLPAWKAMGREQPGLVESSLEEEIWGYSPVMVLVNLQKIGLIWSSLDEADKFISDAIDPKLTRNIGDYVVLGLTDESLLKILMVDYERQKVDVFAYNPVGGETVTLFEVKSTFKTIFMPS